MKNFTIIAGMNLLGGIGYKGSIPWNEPVDMKFFKHITLHNDNKNRESNNVVIMGRKTFESLKCKPLKDRINYVVTSKEFDNVICKKSLDECLIDLNDNNNINVIFVIGGEQLYKEAIKHSNCELIIINIIKNKIECDTFFPEIDRIKFELAGVNNLSPNIESRLYNNKKLIKINT